MILSTTWICFTLAVCVCSFADAHSKWDASELVDTPDCGSSIFNSIISSMRQFGSSINYQGMSAFIATIPRGVKLYQGGSRRGPVRGMQWLAFEPEHAMLFSKPPVEIPSSNTCNNPARALEYDGSTRGNTCDVGNTSPVDEGEAQSASHEDIPIRLGSGYMQTLAVTRPLRLLYLDGMSAAKTDQGTTDFQDHVLLSRVRNSTIEGGDVNRVTQLCQLVAEDWANNVDGFIRMEMGFEVLLCSAEDAELDHIASILTGEVRDGFATYRALEQRFHGIGARRVIIQYESFVTAFHRACLPQSGSKGGSSTTLKNTSGEVLRQLRYDIDRMVWNTQSTTHEEIDWQDIADMVVARYSKPLEYFASGIIQDKETYENEVGRLLAPFINHDSRDYDLERERCASFVLPVPDLQEDVHHQLGIAEATILGVSRTICEALLSSLEESTIELMVRRFEALKKHLDWPVWKRCRGECAWDEICYIPIWPFSALDSSREPSCMNESMFHRLTIETMGTFS